MTDKAKPQEVERFDDFARRIFAVPKEEYDAEVAKVKQAKHKPKRFKVVPAK